MNHRVRFKRIPGKGVSSSVSPAGEVRINKIPEANVIDLRAMMLEREAAAHNREPKKKDQEIPLTKPAPFVPTVRNTKRHNLLFGIFTQREKKARAALPPPLPKSLEKEPAPPPLQEAPRGNPVRWLRGAAGFAVLALILVSPLFALSQLEHLQIIQGRVLGSSTEAYNDLESGRKAVSADNYNGATTAFQDAEAQFKHAQIQLETSSQTLGQLLAVVPKVSSAQHIIVAGKNISRAGQELSQSLGLLHADTLSGITFANQLKSFSGHFDLAADALASASDEIQKVKTSDVPEPFQTQVLSIKSDIPKLNEVMQRFKKSEGVMYTLLGVNSPQRFLLLFQNNNEIRPTGGFIGSLALMDVDGGQIKNLEVPKGGSYDIAGQLSTKVISPTPLHLVNPAWNIQDANWFPDFPASARKVMWFYERSGGPTVDGVVALTPDVLEAFLKLTGPIPMPDFNVTVTDQNVVRLAQSFADTEARAQGTEPKRFITELTPKLLNQVFSLPGDKFLELSGQLASLFASKDILLYFSNNSAVSSAVQELGWDGSILQTARDYLYVVHANIGGGKTDRVIENLQRLTTEIGSDGKIVNTLTITRVHHGNPQDKFEGVSNVDYVRVYVPNGSMLISAEGFERIPSFRFQNPESGYTFDQDLQSVEGTPQVDEATGTRITSEFGKTVFGNWITVDPGASTTATIKYQLPFTFTFRGLLTKAAEYSILVEKQPGVENAAFIQTITPPGDLSYSFLDDRITHLQDRLLISQDLSTDKFFGFVAQKN